MPPRGRRRKRQPQEETSSGKTGIDPLLSSVRESYESLQAFKLSAAKLVLEQAGKREPNRDQIETYEQFSEWYRRLLDYFVDDDPKEQELVAECDSLCDFLRNRISVLYALPIQHIFNPTKPSSNDPISSSPILGLMSYIYRVKLRQCLTRFSNSSPTRFLNDKLLVGECWENLLSSFGVGIRLHILGTAPSPRLSLFQELAGQVLVPFVGEVMTDSEIHDQPRIGEHVKRSLLDAVDAVGGGCAISKKLIKAPTHIGSPLLSQIIAHHSDFATVNLALQLAFTVAPPAKPEKNSGKKRLSSEEAFQIRVKWFKEVFPVSVLGKELYEGFIEKISMMKSKQFWDEVGDLQAQLVKSDYSKAQVLSILAARINQKELIWGDNTMSAFKSNVQFNKYSLTWCSLTPPDEKVDRPETERTWEIDYHEISKVELQVPEDLKLDLKTSSPENAGLDSTIQPAIPALMKTEKDWGSGSTLMTDLFPPKTSLSKEVVIELDVNEVREASGKNYKPLKANERMEKVVREARSDISLDGGSDIPLAKIDIKPVVNQANITSPVLNLVRKSPLESLPPTKSKRTPKTKNLMPARKSSVGAVKIPQSKSALIRGSRRSPRVDGMLKRLEEKVKGDAKAFGITNQIESRENSEELRPEKSFSIRKSHSDAFGDPEKIDTREIFSMVQKPDEHEVAVSASSDPPKRLKVSIQGESGREDEGLRDQVLEVVTPYIATSRLKRKHGHIFDSASSDEEDDRGGRDAIFETAQAKKSPYEQARPIEIVKVPSAEKSRPSSKKKKIEKDLPVKKDTGAPKPKKNVSNLDPSIYTPLLTEDSKFERLILEEEDAESLKVAEFPLTIAQGTEKSQLLTNAKRNFPIKKAARAGQSNVNRTVTGESVDSFFATNDSSSDCDVLDENESRPIEAGKVSSTLARVSQKSQPFVKRNLKSEFPTGSIGVRESNESGGNRDGTKGHMLFGDDSEFERHILDEIRSSEDNLDTDRTKVEVKRGTKNSVSNLKNPQAGFEEMDDPMIDMIEKFSETTAQDHPESDSGSDEILSSTLVPAQKKEKHSHGSKVTEIKLQEEYDGDAIVHKTLKNFQALRKAPHSLNESPILFPKSATGLVHQERVLKAVELSETVGSSSHGTPTKTPSKRVGITSQLVPVHFEEEGSKFTNRGNFSKNEYNAKPTFNKKRDQQLRFQLESISPIVEEFDYSSDDVYSRDPISDSPEINLSIQDSWNVKKRKEDVLEGIAKRFKEQVNDDQVEDTPSKGNTLTKTSEGSINSLDELLKNLRPDKKANFSTNPLIRQMLQDKELSEKSKIRSKDRQVGREDAKPVPTSILKKSKARSEAEKNGLFDMLKSRPGTKASGLEPPKVDKNLINKDDHSTNGSSLGTHEEKISACMMKLNQVILDSIGRKKASGSDEARKTKTGILHLTENVLKECVEDSKRVLDAVKERHRSRNEWCDKYRLILSGINSKVDREVDWVNRYFQQDQED